MAKTPHEADRNCYQQGMKEYRRALEIACEDLEALKPKGNLCIMAIIDEETAAHCSGQNDCDECLKWYFYKRALADLDMQQFCKDEIDGRKEMDAQDQEKEMKGGK